MTTVTTPDTAPGTAPGTRAFFDSPADLRELSYEELTEAAREIRRFLVETVSATGGHLGSNLGAVELTLALHRVYDSPRDAVLWDTGHQAYVHKLVTGRGPRFSTLRQAGGLSGYPNRAESPHDWIENSHASTATAYAHGLAQAFASRGERRRVVAVVGDGSLTGGMAFEGLNNLGRSGLHAVVVLNDNGRSYAPTASRLQERLRGSVSSKLHDLEARQMAALLGRDGTGPAGAELHAMYLALGGAPRPESFFHSLGLAYIGPVDGHSVPEVERALREAEAVAGPVVVHVVTRKGRGYSFAEDDEEKCLHDVSVFDPVAGPAASVPAGYTGAFARTLIELAEQDERIHALTAAMPGPTGLLAFQARFPDRFHDVGIAEQHAVAMAGALAMGGLRPVVAVYSTFLSRAFDQLMMDVGLHGQPVVFALDRAGITGDDGPSHHGVADLALCSLVPGMTVLAPSTPEELSGMLRYALTLPGPAAIRWPKGTPAEVPGAPGAGGSARLLRAAVEPGRAVAVLAVGRMCAAALGAAELAAASGADVAVWDVRCVKPLDERMLEAAAGYRAVVTVEDGFAVGGAGSAIAAALAARSPGSAAPTVLGVPNRYLAHGKPDAVLAGIGLDAEGIAAAVVAAARRS
ncbi:1-deoxy-D-xylulose-5-phosphate synthase [Catenulispora rubra]|uniref:1-deoxy-D-xylulose-5-phosphate synthase n=1 Tax=Catenulispora rubra TaxID=280293 RepID=UPI001891F691|nr:1-deoxy-D-xylulose-5-phosphate synthase [Catenulispora rubra]